MKLIKIGPGVEIKLKNSLVAQSLPRWDLSNYKVKDSGKLHICHITCPICEEYQCVSIVFGKPNSAVGSCPLYPCIGNLRTLLKVKKFAFYFDQKVIYYTSLKKKEAEAQIKLIHKTLEKAAEV